MVHTRAPVAGAAHACSHSATPRAPPAAQSHSSGLAAPVGAQKHASLAHLGLKGTRIPAGFTAGAHPHALSSTHTGPCTQLRQRMRAHSGACTQGDGCSAAARLAAATRPSPQAAPRPPRPRAPALAAARRRAPAAAAPAPAAWPSSAAARRPRRPPGAPRAPPRGWGTRQGMRRRPAARPAGAQGHGRCPDQGVCHAHGRGGLGARPPRRPAAPKLPWPAAELRCGRHGRCCCWPLPRRIGSPRGL